MPMKPVIYQVLPRLFGNKRGAKYRNKGNVFAGSIEENGVGKFSNFTPQVLKSLKMAGYTHIWYTCVLDHATQTDYTQIGQPATNPSIVKGRAGSGYAVRDYYNVDPDLADSPDHRFEEWMSLIKRTHRAGLKVIMDFVPNHVARNYHSVSAPDGVRDLGADDRTDWHFSPNNNFYYCVGESFSPQFDRQGYIEYPARATGNDCFSATPSTTDWYETVKLNYGVDYCGGRINHFNPVPDTWHKMVEILEFWTSHGIDGFRCDMAEMVPVEFWHWAISRVRALNPEITFIAEIYNPSLYRQYIEFGGFDYLYDKVGLYDTLHSIVRHNAPASSITYAWQAVDDIKRHMLSFVENHDEVRIASNIDRQYTTSQLACRGFVATAVAMLMPAGATMIYAGQEVGETASEAEGFSGKDGRTTIFDYWRVERLYRLQQTLNGKAALDADDEALRLKYNTLLPLAALPIVADGGFYDLMWLNTRNPQFDPDTIYAFVRHLDRDILLVVANFSNTPANVGIALAQHMFDTIGIQPTDNAEAVDLLTEKPYTLSFIPQKLTTVPVPANDVLCLHFKA